MWRQFLAALILCACTVCIHALGTYTHLHWILRALKNRRLVRLAHAWWVTLRLVIFLLFLHALEIAVWAQFYVMQRCFPDGETAYYYSLVTYTTLGQGDVLLPRAWRIAGGCEAMIGLLLFGWSTAVLVTFTNYVRNARVSTYLSVATE